jgi:DMSO/TMAO reductase YedYZ heme-binding membrane subunit
MTIDKAARLAAIREANGQAPAASAPPATAPRVVPEATFLSAGMRLTLGLLLVLVAGLLVAAIAAVWQPILDHSVPHLARETALAFARATALVGYVLIWASMALGLAITSKLARLWPGGPAATELHQHLSLLGLVAACAHVVFLLSAPGLGYTLAAAFSPFLGSSYRPMWMGLVGKCALYLLATVALTFFVRGRIGGRWWRRIHFLSFAAYAATLVHSAAAGSDTLTPWALALYTVSCGSLAALTAHRVRHTRAQRAASQRLRAAGLSLSPAEHTVLTPGGQTVRLRPLEARLLRYLMEHAGQDLPAEQIAAAVWGPQYATEIGMVAAYVRRLRARIEPDPERPVHLICASELRYRLADTPTTDPKPEQSTT